MKKKIRFKIRSKSLIRRIAACIFAVLITTVLNPLSLALKFEGTSSPADTYMYTLTIAQ